ncbi:MAG: Gfo/Idh/MocA family protein [Candidatus Helarchaeota archaeon]
MLNLAIIGAGAIARRGHLPAWLKVPGVKIELIIDIDLNLAKKVASEFSIPNVENDIKNISKYNIDIVDICTPTNTHIQILESVGYDKYHVLMEKPLSLSLQDDVKIYKSIKDKNIKFTMIQNWRVLNSVIEARNRIEMGRIGKIESIHGKAMNHAPTGWTRNKWLYHKNAVLYDFTPHLIDVILHLSQKNSIRSVFAKGYPFTPYVDFLGSAFIIIEFDDNMVAFLDNSWRTNISKFDVQIYGTGGTIELDLKQDICFEYHGVPGLYSQFDMLMKKYINVIKGVIKGDISVKPLLAYRKIFSDFVDSIINDTETPMPIRDGVRVGIALEAAKRSIQEGNPIYVKDLFKYYEFEI